MTSRPCDAYGVGPGVSRCATIAVIAPQATTVRYRCSMSANTLNRNAFWNAEASDPYLH
jgi:hypothetical protein